MILAKRAMGVSPSLTLAITAKAKKMQEDGIKVVNFGAGEPDFNTPDYILSAGKLALDKGMTKYTPSSGTLPLRKMICDKLLRDNNLTYKPSQIVVSNGAKHSLHNAMQVIIDDGDEVIIPAPYWLTYPELVKLSGGIPVIVDTAATEFKLTPDALAAAITPKTKALVFNSPSNPTGTVYSKAEIQALAEVIERAGIYVISDEIYEKLVYGVEHYSISSYSDALYEHTILVNGVSKTYSMTGWRIGYLACAQEIATAIDNLQSHTTSNASSISQYGSQIALGGGADFLTEMVGVFDVRRRLMLATIAKMKHVSCIEPKGAFYVMINISSLFGKDYCGEKITSAQQLAELLLVHAQIAVVPGEAFGADNYLRLSYAISNEDIVRGLASLDSFLAKVN